MTLAMCERTMMGRMSLSWASSLPFVLGEGDQAPLTEVLRYLCIVDHQEDLYPERVH